MIDWSATENKVTEEDLAKQLKYSQGLQYLRETDWYLIRKLETLEEVPENVMLNRAKARQIIKEYKNATQ